MRDIPLWLIITLLIVGYAVSNNLYLSYKTVEINNKDVFCKADTVMVKKQPFDIFGMGTMDLSLSCLEYKSSRCRPVCANAKPVCQCEASVYDRLFHQPGDWLLGFLGS